MLKFLIIASKAAIKAVAISLVLMSMTIFNGVLLILNYASKIFKDSGSTLSPNLSSIIIAIIQIIGSLLASNLIERSGRKFLMILSCIGTGLGLFFIGTFLYLKDIGINLSEFDVLPIIFVSGILLFSSLGISTLPYVIISETCSQKVKINIFIYLPILICFLFLRFEDKL